MKQTERERIERVLKKLTSIPGSYGNRMLGHDEVIDLLRRELANERARVRRIVKGEMWCGGDMDSYKRGANDALEAVLAALSGRKGKR